MRFRKTAGRPPYLNRADQRRLLYLFGLLVVVLIAMRLAANPRMWSWLFVGAERSSTGRVAKKTTMSGKERSDGDLHRPAAPLQPNEFRSAVHSAESSRKTLLRKTATGETKTEQQRAHASEPAGKNQPEAAKRVQKKQAGESAGDLPVLSSDGLTLNASFLERVVEDRELGITYDEFPVYKAVLQHVRTVDPQKLEQQARRNVPYALLMSDPKSQRGRLIRLEGRLGSLKEMTHSELYSELGSLYEAWIVTDDSGNDPYRVVFVELPAGLKPRDLYDPPLPVRVTGYFFKVQKYEVERRGDRARYHYAPLLLARRLEWNREQSSASEGLVLAPYLMGFALLLGLILAVVLWRFSRSDRQFAEQQLARYDTRQTADVSALKQLPVGETPEEFFRKLEDQTATQPAGENTPPENDEAGTENAKPADDA